MNHKTSRSCVGFYIFVRILACSAQWSFLKRTLIFKNAMILCYTVTIVIFDIKYCIALVELQSI